jgi:hypothetical protein
LNFASAIARKSVDDGMNFPLPISALRRLSCAPPTAGGDKPVELSGGTQWQPRPHAIGSSANNKLDVATATNVSRQVLEAPQRQSALRQKKPHGRVYGREAQSRALPMHPARSKTGSMVLDSPQIVGRRLAGLAIGDNLEFDFLAFCKASHSGAFDCADMHKDVVAAFVRLNESKPLLAVEPLHSSR